jgi:hypothetical protein
MIIAGQALRELKHELRTPINHMIGYSELLMEAADARGESSVSLAVLPIRTGGERLTRFIEEFLPSTNAEVTDGDLERLRESFRGVLISIIHAPVLDAIAMSDAYGADMARVRSAAAALFFFANHEELPQAEQENSSSAAKKKQAASAQGVEVSLFRASMP